MMAMMAMMAMISIEETDLAINVQGVDKFWSLKSRLTIADGARSRRHCRPKRRE